MFDVFVLIAPVFAGFMLCMAVARTIWAQRAKQALKLSLKAEKPEDLKHLQFLVEILKNEPDRLEIRDILHIQESLHDRLKSLKPRDREYVQRTLQQASLKGRAAYAANVIEEAVSPGR